MDDIQRATQGLSLLSSSKRLDCTSPIRQNTWKPAWVEEKRLPIFLGGGPEPMFGQAHYLWGVTPATDVLNLSPSENRNHGRDLNLCFAASGDLRDVIYSLNRLADYPTGTCTTIVNDYNYFLVARSVAFLLLAAALPPSEAAEIIIHIWYSARLTVHMVAALDKYVTKEIAEVNTYLQDRSDNIAQEMIWRFGTTVIKACLYKSQWKAIHDMLAARHDVVKTERERKKIVLASDRADHRDRELCLLSSSQRMGAVKFRETGVLAPFGTCLDPFDRPNPLLFDPKSSEWLQSDVAAPREGWSTQSASFQATTEQDFNGILYFHVRKALKIFCRRVQDPRHTIRFYVYCVDATLLPNIMDMPTMETGFDRIYVSCLVDENHLGLDKTLEIFGPWLKNRNINPNACIIGLFLNACGFADRENQNKLGSAASDRGFNKALQYGHPEGDEVEKMNTAKAWRLIFAGTYLMKDHDALFQSYMESRKFKTAGDVADLKMRNENLVVQPWPLRLTKKTGERGAEEEFYKLAATSNMCEARYVEWIRKE
ncbi:MAG: hypothetical protein Q9218_003964 [Villophora microphyllina]